MKKLALNSVFEKLKSWHLVPSLHGKYKGKKVEAVTDFIFLGSKITADSDCNHDIKRFAPWKENYDKPRQHIKKQRHHIADRGLIDKAMVFLVVMCRYERWTIKEGREPKN